MYPKATKKQVGRRRCNRLDGSSSGPWRCSGANVLRPWSETVAAGSYEVDTSAAPLVDPPGGASGDSLVDHSRNPARDPPGGGPTSLPYPWPGKGCPAPCVGKRTI